MPSPANLVAQFASDTDLMHRWLNGPASGSGSTVETESGAVRTPARLIAEKAFELTAVAAAAQDVLSNGVASLLFTPGIPGAVPYSVQEKLRETVSALSLGAKGDRATDDTAKLQALLNAYKRIPTTVVPAPGDAGYAAAVAALEVEITSFVKTSPMVVIDLAGRDYKLSAPLDFSDLYNIELANGGFVPDTSAAWGSLPMVSLAMESEAPYPTDNWRNYRMQNVSFRRVTFNGGKSDTFAGVNCALLKSAYGVTFKDCTILGFRDDGYGIRTVPNPREGAVNPSVMQTKCGRLRIIDCNASQYPITEDKTGAGTAYDINTADCKIEGGKAFKVDVGISFDNATNAQILGCHTFTRGTGYCLKVGPNAAGLLVTNFYADTGIVELRSFKHKIDGLGILASASLKLVATKPDEDLAGLDCAAYGVQPIYATEGAGTWASVLKGIIRGVTTGGNPLRGANSSLLQRGSPQAPSLRFGDMTGIDFTSGFNSPGPGEVAWSAGNRNVWHIDANGRIRFYDRAIFNDRVLIGSNGGYAAYGTSFPQMQMHGNLTQEVSYSAVKWDTAGANGGQFIVGRSASDVVGTNAALAAGRSLGRFAFIGDTGAGFSLGAQVSASTTGPWSAASTPAKLTFWTNPAGSASPVAVWDMTEDGHLVPAGARDIGAPSAPVRVGHFGRIVEATSKTVMGYGAVADGTTNCAAAVRAALADRRNGWALAYFREPGVYYLPETISLGAKTVVVLGAGVTLKLSGTSRGFINGVAGTTDGPGGYAGNGQIIFTGDGTVDCGGGIGFASLAHAEGIVFRGLHFENALNTHFIEINSSKDVSITECHFRGLASTDKLSEMIQIDAATSSGYPFFGPWDNTACCNVIITRCTFKDGHSGVGTHSNPAAALHRGITVRDCAFYSLTDYGIRAQGWGEGSEVSNNYVQDVAGRPIYVLGNTDGCDFLYNTVKGGGAPTLAAFWFTDASGAGPKSCNVVGNKVYDTAGSGFRLGNITGGVVRLNEVYRTTGTGITLSSGTTDVLVQHNKIYGCSSAFPTYPAIYVGAGCVGNTVEHNRARLSLTGTFTSSYRDGVWVDGASASQNRVNWNDLEPRVAVEPEVAGVKVRDEGTLTEIDGETYLTGGISATTGEITLRDDITKYQRLRIGSGSVGSGTMMISEARGWYSAGFRPGTDSINVHTRNGVLSMSIPTATSLSITGTAPDAVRYVIGVGRAS